MKLSDSPNCEVFIEVIKACVTYKDLLDTFELEFASNFIRRFSVYGLSTNIELKQENIMLDIKKKLNI
jgi:hypothetical protein